MCSLQSLPLVPATASTTATRLCLSRVADIELHWAFFFSQRPGQQLLHVASPEQVLEQEQHQEQHLAGCAALRLAARLSIDSKWQVSY